MISFLANLKGHELSDKCEIFYTLALFAFLKTDYWKVHIFSSGPKIISLLQIFSQCHTYTSCFSFLSPFLTYAHKRRNDWTAS